MSYHADPEPPSRARRSPHGRLIRGGVDRRGEVPTVPSRGTRTCLGRHRGQQDENRALGARSTRGSVVASRNTLGWIGDMGYRSGALDYAVSPYFGPGFYFFLASTSST